MITEEQAIAIARRRAESNGWAFGEPLDVYHRRDWFGRPGNFEIWTNAGSLGTKAHFTIHDRTGAILSEGYIPR